MCTIHGWVYPSVSFSGWKWSALEMGEYKHCLNFALRKIRHGICCLTFSATNVGCKVVVGFVRLQSAIDHSPDVYLILFAKQL